MGGNLNVGKATSSFKGLRKLGSRVWGGKGSGCRGPKKAENDLNRMILEGCKGQTIF